MSEKTPKQLPKNLVLRGDRYYVRVQHNGKVYRISTGQTDLKLAEKVAREIRRKIDRGEVETILGITKPADVPTYGAYALKFCGQVETAQGLAKTSRTNYLYQLQPSIDAWDDMKLDAITSDECAELLTDLAGTGNYKPNTIRQFRLMSNMLLRRAVQAGLIKANPWATVPTFVVPKQELRERVLTVGEQGALIGAIDHTGVRRLSRLWFAGGLRIGESRQLVPAKHLDFAGGRFKLTKDITKGGKERTVPMFPDARAALEEQLAARGLTMTSTEPLFGFSQCFVHQQFAAALKRIDIPHCTPHDARRTFATRMALEGTPMNVLQEWMGHSNISITAKFYTHVNEEASMKVAKQVGGALPVYSTVVGFETKKRAQI